MDAVGHTASQISSFEVDRSPPSIDLFVERQNSTRERAGDTISLSGDAIIAWDISDKNGVKSASVLLPGAGEIQSGESASALINATALSDGTYELSVAAEDAAGNIANKTLPILVDKVTPEVTLVAPTGFEVRGPAKLAIGASDANLKDATLMIGDRRTVNVTGLNEYTLDTTELPDGPHILKLIAKDIAGNENTATANINVSNVAPQLMNSALLGLAAGGAIATGAWLAILRGGRRRSSSQ